MGKFNGLLSILALAAIVPISTAADAPALPETATPENAAPVPPAALGPLKLSPLTMSKEQISYAVGMSFGNYIKGAELDVDMEMLIQGMKDSMSGRKAILSEQDFQTALKDVQNEVVQKQAQHKRELAEKNKKEAVEFLAQNSRKEGVVTLPSGLQYKVIQQGDGKVPTATDVVKVHYRSMLMDGTEFDNSYKRGTPAIVTLNSGVLKGMAEGLQIMKVGTKLALYIPSDLAYGEQGYGPVRPNAVLVSEVELLGIEEPPQTPQTPK